MNFTVQSDKGLVLIDTGYYLFNRYFATLKWYRIVKKETIDIASLHTTDEFVDAFKTHIRNDLTKYATFPYIHKKFSGHLTKKKRPYQNKIIFCIDCPRAKIWRMRHYSSYKGTRKQSADMNMNMVTIFYEFMDSLNELSEAEAECMDICKASKDGLEADDIVYLMMKRLRQEGYKSPILVITNDNDFIQMVSMNAIVANTKGVHLQERVQHDPNVSIMLKILTGDTSDNIKGVPCIGNNMTLALEVGAMKEKERMAWIEEHGGVDSIRAYHLNKKLILLSKIPSPLVRGFHDKVTLKVI